MLGDSTISLNNTYIRGKKLASGSYGEVFLGYRIQDKTPIAIKTIDLNKKQNDERRLKIEINSLRKMNHENVMKLYDVYQDDKNNLVYLMTEFCDGGDLSQVMNKRLTEEEAKNYIKK